ncbi:MAG: hypothetical protein LBU15_02975 [Rickettsiales bacterium]|jgi:hypothetical protein|nr:hypothetical protein [Rickettsiales bacterium]
MRKNLLLILPLGLVAQLNSSFSRLVMASGLGGAFFRVDSRVNLGEGNHSQLEETDWNEIAMAMATISNSEEPQSPAAALTPVANRLYLGTNIQRGLDEVLMTNPVAREETETTEDSEAETIPSRPRAPVSAILEEARREERAAAGNTTENNETQTATLNGGEAEQSPSCISALANCILGTARVVLQIISSINTARAENNPSRQNAANGNGRTNQSGRNSSGRTNGQSQGGQNSSGPNRNGRKGSATGTRIRNYSDGQPSDEGYVVLDDYFEPEGESSGEK